LDEADKQKLEYLKWKEETQYKKTEDYKRVPTDKAVKDTLKKMRERRDIERKYHRQAPRLLDKLKNKRHAALDWIGWDEFVIEHMKNALVGSVTVDELLPTVQEYLERNQVSDPLTDRFLSSLDEESLEGFLSRIGMIV
jgi:hypothetical protein